MSAFTFGFGAFFGGFMGIICALIALELVDDWSRR